MSGETESENDNVQQSVRIQRRPNKFLDSLVSQIDGIGDISCGEVKLYGTFLV